MDELKYLIWFFPLTIFYTHSLPFSNRLTFINELVHCFHKETDSTINFSLTIVTSIERWLEVCFIYSQWDVIRGFVSFQEDIDDEELDDGQAKKEQSITDLFDVVISNPTPVSYFGVLDVTY